MIRFRNLFFSFIFFSMLSVFASASDIYIAQNAAGGNTGADCADAHSAAWFNSSANWGSGAAQIGPGTTVHLCGTFSGALTAQGSGTSGSPITILFDSATSGQISMPALPSSGALVLDGRAWITVDGNNQIGVIKSTDNGSAAGGYGNQVCSLAISASGAGNITVRELQILNLYVHTSPSDTTAGGCTGVGPPGAVYFPGGTGSITIDHVVATYCATCFNGDAGTTGTVTVSNGSCTNFDHCLGMGNNNTTPTVKGPVYFYNMGLDGMAAWDSTTNVWHHDGIHLFAYCSDGGSYCAGTYWNNVYIYNNHFYGDPGANMNSWIFNEENIHNEWAFNNLIDTSARALSNGGGPVYGQGNTVHFVNNSFIGNPSQSVTNLNMGGPNVTSQNNASCNAQLVGVASTDESGNQSTSISALGNNYYMNGNTNAFIWEQTFLGFSQFSSWESDSGEVNSKTSPGCSINSNGTLQAGSIAIGGGKNLYSTCNGQANPGIGALCYDAAGNSRPSSGAWDAGAFSYQTNAGGPTPPTDLQAVVQ